MAAKKKYKVQPWTSKQKVKVGAGAIGALMVAAFAVTFYFGGSEILPAIIQEMVDGRGYNTCSRIGTTIWQCDRAGDSNQDGLCFKQELVPAANQRTIENLRDLARKSGESCLLVVYDSTIKTYNVWEVNGQPDIGNTPLGFNAFSAKNIKKGNYLVNWGKDNLVR